MLYALGFHLVEWILAFLALDLLFRTLDLRPEGLAARIRRCRLLYALLAAAATAAAGAVQIALAGAWGWAAAAGWLPWWLLWRFGWRKQFTHLYRRDGGRDLRP